MKVCHDKGQLQQHVQTLRESPLIMLEEFLSGEEATITVMPPTIEHPQHWSMLTVTRFNYAEGIAPYNGVVAVTSNSRVISQSELKDPGYRKVMRECESVAALVRATAPVCRRVGLCPVRYKHEAGKTSIPTSRVDERLKEYRT